MKHFPVPQVGQNLVQEALDRSYNTHSIMQVKSYLWTVGFCLKKLPKKLIFAWVLAYCSSRQNFKHNSSPLNVILYDTRSGGVSIGPVVQLVLYNSK